MAGILQYAWRRLPVTSPLRNLLIAILVACPMASAASATADARLLYARQLDSDCEIGVYAGSDASQSIGFEAQACPSVLLVDAERKAAYALIDDDVVTFDLAAEFTAAVVAKAPNLDLAAYLDGDIEKPHPSLIEEMPSLGLRVRAAGRLPDGSLALHAALDLPFGGSLDYLFAHADGRWSIVDSFGCGNWELDCSFRQLGGTSSNLWSWAEEKLVWHPAIARNPNLRSDAGEFPGRQQWRFVVDGVQVVMDVYTFDSAHYDTVYTGGLVLRWDGERELVICDEQCRATIGGRWVLAQRFWGGTLELIDMATGESVLGELAQAVWVDRPRVDYAEARGELVSAYQSGDFAVMVEASEKALRARLEYPGGLFNLALSHALNDEPGRALETLNRLLGLGVDYGVADMDEFADVRQLEGWPAYAAGIEKLNEPVGDAKVVLQLDDGHFVPEGIAVGPSGAIYLGSIRRGLLTRTLGDTEVLSDRAGHWSVFGIRIARDRSIWFASAAVPQLEGVGEDAGKTGLFRFDPEQGRITDSAVLPQFADEQVLGDLVLSYNGYVYATDSLTGGVYRYGIRSGDFSEVVARGRLASPQGLALTENQQTLYVADYVGGLYRVLLGDGRLQKVVNLSGRTDYGIDGLYRYGDELVAIQNGVRPHRVVGFRLSPDGLSISGARTIASNLPEFDEPTLGAVRGDHLYFVANSHWNRFDRDNRLPDGLSGPIILAVPLEQKGVDTANQNRYSDSR